MDLRQHTSEEVEELVLACRQLQYALRLTNDTNVRMEVASGYFRVKSALRPFNTTVGGGELGNEEPWTIP